MTDAARRFFKMACAEARDGAYHVALDGRPLRTPKGGLLKVPTLAFAQAIAEEWNALGDRLDPRALPLTKLANTAIDGVERAREHVLSDLGRFAAADLLCYRADGPDSLIGRQCEAWDPWLAWAQETFGAALLKTKGIVHVSQPPEAVRLLQAAAHPLDPFALTALHVAVTLTGSLVLGLALARGSAGAREVWAIATVDEAWQQEQWGEDAEAAERSRALLAELEHAARIFVLLAA